MSKHDFEHKYAQTDYPVIDVIRQRWSPRAFDNRLVEREKLLSIFEAARWAASSSNLQPWHFIIATRDNEAEFEKMKNILNEGNQTWAKEAPMLIIAVAKLERGEGKPNRHAWHDTGMAIAHITLQATALGLYCHMMGGFNPEAARDTYNIPEGYEAVTAMALGYYGYDKLEQLSERHQQNEQAERSRKPLSEMLFSGDWQQPADILD